MLPISPSSPFPPFPPSPTPSKLLSNFLTTVNNFERSLDISLPHLKRTYYPPVNRSPSYLRELSPTLFGAMNSNDTIDMLTKKKAEMERRRKESLKRRVFPMSLTPTPKMGKIDGDELGRIQTKRFLPIESEQLSPGSATFERKKSSVRDGYTYIPKFIAAEPILTPKSGLRTTILLKNDTLSCIKEHMFSMEKFKPVNWRALKREKARKEEFRASVNRLARKEIEETRKKVVEEYIGDKFRKYEWRLRAEEISEVKKRWQLHIRSASVLKFLLLISICVGKIVLKLKKRRFARASIILRRIIPFVHRFLAKRKQIMSENIVESVERSLSMDIFYKIIMNWKRKVVVLQDAIRRWLERRRAFKSLLLQNWAIFELKMMQKTGKITEVAPDSVKILLLNDFLKKKFQIYLEEFETWKQQCNSILYHYETIQYEVFEESVPLPSLPGKPKFPTLLTFDEMSELIAKADKKKSRWTRIAKETRLLP